MEQVLKVVYNVLSNDADVTGITSRLYPVVAPENTDFPCVVYYVESVTPHGTKTGPSTIDHMYVAVDCYAQDTEAGSGYQSVANLAGYIRGALDRLTPGTYASLSIGGCEFLDSEIGFDKESDVYVVAMTFKFRVHREVNTGPVNTVAPVISGTVERGELLSCTTGTWTGVAITYAYQWRRNGVSIAGATSNTYTLVSADDNTNITCLVTATNEGGQASQVSNTLGPVLGAPLNLVAPAVSGTEQVGETLSVTTGTWQGVATITYAYQWRRDGVDIAGATSNSYTLVAADYNTVIDCNVTATNGFGSTTQDSDNTGAIAGTVPVITGVPTIAGTEQVGETLTATPASVAGVPTPATTWQWQRSADGLAGWANIAGATSITYVLDAADENQYIRVVQTETNVAGSDTANSAATGQIASIALLLDTYPGAAAAYSLEAISSSTTNVARVRRSSDNAEADFTATEITDGTLTTWTGAGDGFVVTWYDQSGNARNATQSTLLNQPQIVASGALILRNSKPCINILDNQSGAIGQYLISPVWHTISAPNVWSFSVYALKVNGNFSQLLGSAPTTRGFGSIHNDATSVIRTYTARSGGVSIYNGSALSLNDQVLRVDTANRTFINSWVNGVNDIIDQPDNDSDFTAATFYYLGNASANIIQSDIDVTEMIFYASDQSANRAAIEAEINSRYSIY